MSAPIVFLDTETCGLSLTDDIWEIAAVRREPDGTETELHLFVEHAGCERLPDAFRSDHAVRFPAECSGQVVSRGTASHDVGDFTVDAHIVGAVPNFDTERLARMMHNHGGHRPKWHYHLIDIENVVVGYLSGSRRRQLLLPPWSSEALSEAIAIDPTDYARHTAMGDVRWVMAQWDAVMAGTP